MDSETRDLSDQYRSALNTYLDRHDEAGLQRAYDLGRQALKQGLGVVEMAALQHDALHKILQIDSPRLCEASVFELARNFMLESLSPFEMTHRGFSEDNVALRRLNERLAQQMEEQAKHIGQTLHDEAGQLLTAVHISVSQLERELTPAGRIQLARVEDMLRQVQEQIRVLSHEFRPRLLDDLGLMPALDTLAQGVSARSGISVEVRGPRTQRVPPPIETVLYRTVQEALTNASRHARATQAVVVIEHAQSSVCCMVRDNGVGFDWNSVMRKGAGHGLGLRGIQERISSVGGNLQIKPASGGGTELVAVIPLQASVVSIQVRQVAASRSSQQS